MDPLSQAVVGATFSQSLSRIKASQKMAFVAGALSGMAADIDVFFRSENDPLLFLEFHRQFTHSLLFIPVGGLICAILLFPFVRRKIHFRSIFGLATLGYASHGLLDACTSYGTQLFWPFSDLRVAWDIISIIDPLFTLPILALVIAGFMRGKAVYSRAGLVYGLMYLAVGQIQHGRAVDALEMLADQRGHVVAKVIAKPTFANLYIWKLIYESEGRYFVDAVKVGATTKYITGESISSVANVEQSLLSTVQLHDVERFRWFSGGYIARDPADPLVFVDIRYSLLPNRIEPLWGIRLKPSDPEQHVEYLISRNFTTEKRLQFFSMLFE